ncbi:MAG TPA: protein kinase [Planctomycetota bacterium]|nr:protein kinase [Planctomycetota bacterium]
MRRSSDSRHRKRQRRRLPGAERASVPPVPPGAADPTPAPSADPLEEGGAGEKDLRIGQILIECQSCTPEQIEKALKIQDDLGALGAETIPRLGELLVRKGFASVAQVEQALDLQESVGRTCASCGAFSPALLLDMNDGENCPQCNSSFGPRMRAVVSAVKEDSEPVPKLVPQLKPHYTHEPVAPELKILGKYELVKELGRGSVGIVYDAVDTSLNRRVALKLLHPLPGPGARESAQDVQQFVKEAQLSANLPKHPNIVTVYEAGLLGRRHFIAMERIEGQPMSSWRRKGSVTIRQQARILRDVALAVHHAHENGILHCDLKPQNVMIDERRRAFVTDFGLARRPGRDPWAEVEDGMTAGTPAYMSPEQARGMLQLDRRTDIYSLGTMLYEIVTGRIPFRARTPEELLNKTVKDPVRPPSGVARSLAAIDPHKSFDKICLKALAKKPGHRYATARAFADDLTRWLRGEGIPGSLPRKDSRTTWIGVAAAVLAVVAAYAGMKAWNGEPGGGAEPPRPDSLQQARRELDQARWALEQKAKADAAALDAERQKVAELQEQAKGRAAVAPVTITARDPIEWLLAGPFANNGIDEVLPPETALDPSAAMPGKIGEVRWKKGLAELRAAGTGRAAVFDFNALFSPHIQTVAYAAIHVKSPAAMDATLYVGSDDGVKVWANGTVIHRHEVGRGLKIDEDRVSFRLLKGWNLLLFKVTQRDQGWGLSARISDDSQRPIDGLEYDPIGDLPQASLNR